MSWDYVANTISIRGCVIAGVPRCWGKVAFVGWGTVSLECFLPLVPLEYLFGYKGKQTFSC